MPDRHFNLDELLGKEHVRHYLRFIEGAGREFVVSAGEAAPRRGMTTYSTGGGTFNVMTFTATTTAPPPEVVVRSGRGPASCSPCTDLALSPEVCWDVCGYYSRLGVHWRATRRQLTDAYLARDGQSSKALTYALAQLFNPRIRRAYDVCPLGSLFLPDRDVQHMIKKAAWNMAGQRQAHGVDHNADDVLREWGLQPDPAAAAEPQDGPDGQPAPPRELPDEEAEEAEEAEESLTLGSTVTGWERQWSWFRMTGREDGEEDLPQWQELLRMAFRIRRMPGSKFAVGVAPGPGFRLWHAPSEGVVIILLGTEPPTLPLALKAVAEWMAYSREVPPHAYLYQGRYSR